MPSKFGGEISLLRCAVAAAPGRSLQAHSRLSDRRRLFLKELMSANLEDARRLLGKGALFRNLAPNDRNSLVARARMRSFNPGDTIFLNPNGSSPGSAGEAAKV